MDSADKVTQFLLGTFGVIITVGVLGFVLTNAGAINSLFTGGANLAKSLSQIT
jgi:hypothetical protein